MSTLRKVAIEAIETFTAPIMAVKTARREHSILEQIQNDNEGRFVVRPLTTEVEPLGSSLLLARGIGAAATLNALDDRAAAIGIIYGNERITPEVAATLALVDADPELARVGQELLDIVVEHANQNQPD